MVVFLVVVAAAIVVAQHDNQYGMHVLSPSTDILVEDVRFRDLGLGVLLVLLVIAGVVILGRKLMG